MSKDKIVSDAKLIKLKEDMQNAEFTDTSIIQDNKYPFKVNEKLYRVKMPTQRELSNAETIKHNAWVTLIQEDNSITTEKLKSVLKDKQNIDIDKLEEKKESLEKKLHDAYISLATSKDTDKKRLAKYKTAIIDIKQQYIEAFCNIELYLSASIENRVDGLYLKTLACYCTEKYDEKKKKWQPMWKDYNQFEKDDSSVAIQACLNFGYLFKFNRGY